MVAHDNVPKVLRKLSPATGELLAELRCTDPQEVAAKIAKARAAQEKWGALDVRTRNRMLLRCAHVLAERGHELAELVSKETGKPMMEALVHDVFVLTEHMSYYSRRAHRILAPRPISLHLLRHRKSYLHYEPRGVIGVISPWNFPLSLGVTQVFMALAAGNAVVHKPSEWTPLSALETPKILAEAGIDPDLVQVLVGFGDVGQAVIEAGVDMLVFTGSVATGRKVAAACGERLIPHVLELGGKDAAIVLDDADLELAANTIAWGAFANTGQICASTERVYAMAPIYDELVERIVAITRRLRQGDGAQEDVEVGPMIMPSQLEVVRRHVDEARERGAKVLTGGMARGNYFAPTVLTDVDESMAIARDETFGPVLPIMKVESVDEAIARANASEFGLSAYVFSRNVRRGREVAERLQAGSSYVNDLLMAFGAPETPWGGLKNSGIGFTHSPEGLRQLCEQRHVNYPVVPSFIPPWVFPYDRRVASSGLDLVRGFYGEGGLWLRAKLVARGLWGLWRHMRVQSQWRQSVSSKTTSSSSQPPT